MERDMARTIDRFHSAETTAGVDRREFITLLGGTAVAWPLASRAQELGKVARIGFLGAASASGYARQVEGFRLGLRDLGYIEGTNIVIDYRWAKGKYERLPELAADLIRSDADVIVTHGTPGSLAASGRPQRFPLLWRLPETLSSPASLPAW